VKWLIIVYYQGLQNLVGKKYKNEIKIIILNYNV
jgi:hypothetical protein